MENENAWKFVVVERRNLRRNKLCARVGKAGLKTTDSLKKCLGREVIPRKTEVLLWLANETRSYVASSSYMQCFSFEVA